MLTKEQIDEFNENGVLVLRNFYNYEEEIKPIQYDIYNIIKLIIEKYKLDIPMEEFNGNNFDFSLMEILKINRTYISEIYDAVKDSVSFNRLISTSKNEKVSKDVLMSTFVGVANGGSGIRIDLPHEEKFRTFWHQEYPAQLKSLKGVVLWSPLVEVIPSLGPVEVCLHSHKNGVLPVFEDKSDSRIGAYTLKLKNEKEIINNFFHVAPLSKPGDLILVNWLVIHQSGLNISNKARWSMQMRYFDFLEPIGQKISWKGSFAKGIKFEEIHPELLVK
ncbi:phytanoyl-CoA dioxygenase family protein [Arcobacter sp.]|uniref:phytanoyl-CoA dioxygenase family protein n=1 Tax=Arcobacter sp. TaxID=1872629 RepID=UPI003D152F3A